MRGEVPPVGGGTGWSSDRCRSKVRRGRREKGRRRLVGGRGSVAKGGA